MGVEVLSGVNALQNLESFFGCIFWKSELQDGLHHGVMSNGTEGIVHFVVAESANGIERIGH